MVWTSALLVMLTRWIRRFFGGLLPSVRSLRHQVAWALLLVLPLQAWAGAQRGVCHEGGLTGTGPAVHAGMHESMPGHTLHAMHAVHAAHEEHRASVPDAVHEAAMDATAAHDCCDPAPSTPRGPSSCSACAACVHAANAVAMVPAWAWHPPSPVPWTAAGGLPLQRIPLLPSGLERPPKPVTV